ncbi:MAG: Pr6Pr family membrane protein [Chitinophagales bacterium]|nr:Pr6Pr family membrane protein [Chitinophagales bacterium]
MKKNFEIIGFIITWLAVIAQLILMIQNRQADIAETVIRFISFFTILTNTLVALYFSTKVFKLSNNLFRRNGALTAITTFILIVGIVYQITLRKIWAPTGLQLIVNELLHTIIPLYFLVYWILYSNKSDYNYKQVLAWIIYPIAYLIFVFTRGYYSNYYPYPFLNISEIGTRQAGINTVIIFCASVCLMLLLIFIGKHFIGLRNSKEN